MDAQAFWNVIGNYNEQTKIIQIGMFIFVIFAIVFSYIQKVNWAAKFALGIANLFIGVVFFAWYGTDINLINKNNTRCMLLGILK